MSSELPSALLREGFAMLAMVGSPFMGALLAVGLVVGLLQAATQINDPAVGFLPRLMAALLVAWFAGGWAVERMAQFLAGAMQRMSQHM
jgi:flagellar biosynthesis protein FliQ